MHIIDKIIREIASYLFCLLSGTPGVLGIRLREFVFRGLLGSCGTRLVVEQGCIIKGFKHIRIADQVNFGPNVQVYAQGNGDQKIEIGSRVSINSNVMINADNGGLIKLGANVIIGPNVVLRASNHCFDKKDVPVRDQDHRAGKIIINEDVWIGANAVILPNTTIGRGAVIGAGAVVTRDVEAFDIVAGVPAKKIGSRGNE